jgi:[protein-PII] uridylyltransferase
MEKAIHTTAPYFDPIELREELAAVTLAAGTASDARKVIVDRLKSLVAEARNAARAGLEADHNGRRCAAGLSQFQDELVRLLYDHSVKFVYRTTNPSDAERMAMVATGGYGRGLLAPHSDIDLLFLLPYKQTPWGESVAEYILYVLWDLGFKVGHATRTIEECVKQSTSDITIRTSLLDARLIQGDLQLFAEFEQSFRDQVVAGTARTFIDAKMGERDVRHRIAGESRYKVEPNIKDGKGGLRDLHTLHWLSKYLYGQGVGAATVAAGIFKSDEVATFRRCENFLWTVRCFLHFIAGRPDEVLIFEVQQCLAERLGYKARGGLRSVERFMKHYFLVAKDVGDLTAILCAALEMQQLKEAPGLSRILAPLNWRARRQVRTRTDFRIDNDRLNVADQGVFKRDPVNLIKLFAEARLTDSFLHPDAIRLLRRSLHLIDDKLRADPEANRIFLDLLIGEGSPEITLRRMNDAGVLGRFVPEFGHVVGMMQFNMYHHFTVDEHLVRTVGMLTDIENGGASTELPLSTEIIKSIENRRALYVAAFLHDIGKGREEDHSIFGARVTHTRFGLSAAETETAAWLVEQHLTMSNFAQSREITDSKTVRDFAELVQSPERLKLLLLLTVADIRAVGPGVWNGWKGQLLRTLYYETEPVVIGGHTQAKRSQRIAEAQKNLQSALKDWTTAEFKGFVDRQYPDYWLRTDTTRQVEHANLLRRADRRGLHLATETKTDAFMAVTELTVVAPNHPRLLALLAGACATAGANIASAQIISTRDGFALDTFLLNRGFQDDEDEIRRGKRIGEMMGRLMRGPEVVIDNALSDQFTVIEVAGRDRAGLLYELTKALSDIFLDITSAHITTIGEKAVDAFYVTDLTGKKITHEPRQEAIRQRLEMVLASSEA